MRFAAYIAMSARRRSSSRVVPCSGAIAMPMLPCTSSDTPAISQGSAIALRSRSATASAARLVGRALAQHAELVAAEPGDDLALADDVVEPGRDDRQQLVPPVVAERVVDLLEPLEIDEEHGQSLLLAILGLQRLVEPLAELRPVGEPGQVVVQAPGGRWCRAGDSSCA